MWLEQAGPESDACLLCRLSGIRYMSTVSFEKVFILEEVPQSKEYREFAEKRVGEGFPGCGVRKCELERTPKEDERGKVGVVIIYSVSRSGRGNEGYVHHKYAQAKQSLAERVFRYGVDTGLRVGVTGSGRIYVFGCEMLVSLLLPAP